MKTKLSKAKRKVYLLCKLRIENLLREENNQTQKKKLNDFRFVRTVKKVET